MACGAWNGEETDAGNVVAQAVGRRKRVFKPPFTRLEPSEEGAWETVSNRESSEDENGDLDDAENRADAERRSRGQKARISVLSMRRRLVRKGRPKIKTR